MFAQEASDTKLRTSLRQTKQTTLLSEYNMTFKTLMMRIKDVDEESRLEAYLRGWLTDILAPSTWTKRNAPSCEESEWNHWGTTLKRMC